MHRSAAISRAVRTISRRRQVRVRRQGAGGGQGVGAAGADGGDAVGRLDHVAGAADQQQVVAVDRDHHRFQAAQSAVHAPVLGQLGGGARHAALEILQLRLEALQQGKGVGGGAGEADQHLAVVQPANLVGVALHDDCAERHLAVAADGGFPVFADGQNRRRSHSRHK